jgi:hypothetical protein
MRGAVIRQDNATYGLILIHLIMESGRFMHYARISLVRCSYLPRYFVTTERFAIEEASFLYNTFARS